jgi:predicted outer membrane repeat protein
MLSRNHPIMKYSSLTSTLNLAFYITWIFLQITPLPAQTVVPAGEVSGLWQKASSPYLVTGDITIPADSQLIIEPGVDVQFQAYYGMQIDGQLLAIGELNDQIHFNIQDTTGFSDPQSTLGGWAGIRIVDPDPNNDTTSLSYCRFEFAKAVGDVWHLNAGGAIRIINFDKVHIANCTFVNNSAGGDPNEVPSGGAIHLAWSDCILTGNRFESNHAQAGGAVYVHESNALFRENQFISNSARQGGALEITGISTPRFFGDLFENNRAERDGGGLLCSNAVIARLQNVHFLNNSAYDGGGISNHACDMYLEGCSLESNLAQGSGGGMYTNGGKVVLSVCELTDNHSEIFGGGLVLFESELSVNDCQISDNTSGTLGGGLHAELCQLTIRNSTFQGDSTYTSGGAISSWQCHSTISDCLFENNRAHYNGGAINADRDTIQISDVRFEQNNAIWGGAILIYKSTAEIHDTYLERNSSEHGGAINSGWSDLNMKKCLVSDNRGIWGGGLTCFNSDVQLDSCSINDNYAESQGGGIEFLLDTTDFDHVVEFNMKDVELLYNQADLRGGAMYIEQFNSPTGLGKINIDQCRIGYNRALRIGAMRCAGKIGDIAISNSWFYKNTAEQFVGACTFANVASARISNCVFASNHAKGSSTGGIGLSNNSQVDLLNCTVVNNSAATGGGLHIRNGGRSRIINTILWNNQPESISTISPSGIPADIFIDFSNVQHGLDSVNLNDTVSNVYWGSGNIDADPNFVDTSELNYALNSSSPCIGQGIDSIWMDAMNFLCPETDIFGNPRPDPAGSQPDIGAFEHELGEPLKTNEIVFEKACLNCQVYPNPIAENLTIRCSCNEKKTIKIDVFNSQGYWVENLIDSYMTAGTYEYKWNVAHYSSGIYLLRLTSTDCQMTKKIYIMR